MDNSPLARLPPELRNTIYHFALDYDRPIQVNRVKQKVAGPSGLRRYLRLTETCRQIRNESIGIFFAGNTFQVFVGRGTVHAFTNATGIKRTAALRNIITYHHEYSWRSNHKWMAEAYNAAKKDTSHLPKCRVTLLAPLYYQRTPQGLLPRFFRVSIDLGDPVASLDKMEAEILERMADVAVQGHSQDLPKMLGLLKIFRREEFGSGTEVKGKANCSVE